MSADDLYVIGEGDGSGVVKIGRSVDPESRLRTLQTGYPRKLTLLHVEPGGGHLEPKLHERFASLQTHGEWFDFRGTNPVAAVLTAIDAMHDFERALEAERARHDERVTALQQQIEIERLIFRKELEMRDLAIYTQDQVDLLTAEIKDSVVRSIVGDSREEVDAQVAAQRERLGLSVGVAA